MQPAVIIEDRATFGPLLGRQLERLGVRARWMTHPDAVAVPADQWLEVPLVLLDALDLSSQQEDHARSRLAALGVLTAIGTLAADQRPRVIVYSTDMAAPEVNLVLARCPGVTARYEAGALLHHLPDIVTGDYVGRVADPVAADWVRLHPEVRPDADLAEVHRRMQAHERAWRQVWDGDALFDKAAQVWIRRNVSPLLGDVTTGYGVAVEVTRKLAGLPYRVA